MSVEVIAIGDEVLAGYTINSNGAHISRKLTELGYKVAEQRVLPDDHDLLLPALKAALAKHDMVICCGGLGPTFDDNTRRTVAELAGCPIEQNDEVLARLQERYGERPTLIEQSQIPTKATPLHNEVGTAPGLFLTIEGSLLIMLPGVPREMEALLEKALPLIDLPRQKREVKTIRIFETPEVEVNNTLPSEGVYGIYPAPGIVSVRGTKAAIAELEKRFAGKTFYAETLEEELHQRLVGSGLTLACAESCTGGSLAAHITRLPGASEYFLGSIVSYSDAMKENFLGAKVVNGAVSAETARNMVLGLLEQSGADLGVAITGIAGPTGGSEEKPVGTIYFATAKKGGEPKILHCQMRGNRSTIIEHSVNNALAELIKIL